MDLSFLRGYIVHLALGLQLDPILCRPFCELRSQIKNSAKYLGIAAYCDCAAARSVRYTRARKARDAGKDDM